MTHRPRFRAQFGDSSTADDAVLCTMACGAMALDYHTSGAIRMKGGELVKKTKLTPTEISDGTNLNDVAAAWAAISKERNDKSIVLQIRRNTPWSDVKSALAAGRAVILQGNYNVLDKQFKCQAKPLKGKGGHAILLLPEQSGGNIIVGDPLCSDFKPIPEAQLRKFAEKFSSANNVLHANTKAFATAPVVAPAPKRAAAAPAAPPPVPDGIDPNVDLPVALCSVAATTLFKAATGSAFHRQAFAASTVGLYSRPLAGSARTRVAVRVDLLGPGAEDLRIGWVESAAVSNIRIVG